MNRDRDEHLRTVKADLLRAARARVAVRVYLRGDPVAGHEVRMLEGVPVAFRQARDGRAQVALEVARGEVEQLVLLDRIARVVAVPQS